MYPSIMPAQPKLLPRPCPQCGKEIGGCQLVLFNPKYYYLRSGYARSQPYVILRISHGYSKTERTKHNTRKKIVHNFSSSYIWNFTIGYGSNTTTISSDQIFNHPDYMYTQCITDPPSPQVMRDIKANGWLISETSGAHWIKRAQRNRTILSSVPVPLSAPLTVRTDLSPLPTSQPCALVCSPH